jgi:hypothetical protein
MKKLSSLAQLSELPIMRELDLPDYDQLAKDLSMITGEEVSSTVLRQFENPHGSNSNYITINSKLSGFSGAFTSVGYDATFKLVLPDRPYLGYAAQRSYYDSSHTHEEVVRETLDAVIKLQKDPSRGFRFGLEIIDYHD